MTSFDDLGVVRIRDLQEDNIDLIQSAEAMQEFCESAGYHNDDDFEFGFIIWDKPRSGTIMGVYGSHTVDLDGYAHTLHEITKECPNDCGSLLD